MSNNLFFPFSTSCIGGTCRAVFVHDALKQNATNRTLDSESVGTLMPFFPSPLPPSSCKPGNEPVLQLFDMPAGVHPSYLLKSPVLTSDASDLFQLSVRPWAVSLHASTSL
jgi:hypothetical protein